MVGGKPVRFERTDAATGWRWSPGFGSTGEAPRFGAPSRISSCSVSPAHASPRTRLRLAGGEARPAVVAAVETSASGGPVFDRRGSLVGLIAPIAGEPKRVAGVTLAASHAIIAPDVIRAFLGTSESAPPGPADLSAGDIAAREKDALSPSSARSSGRAAPIPSHVPFLGAGAGEFAHPLLVARRIRARRPRRPPGRRRARRRGRRSRPRRARSARPAAPTRPRARAAATIRNTSSTISGARPCEGSSSISSFGLSSSARAIDSISCSPPESWPPLLRLALARAAGTPRRRARSSTGPGRSTGTRRFSSTVRLAKTRRPSGT